MFNGCTYFQLWNVIYENLARDLTGVTRAMVKNKWYKLVDNYKKFIDNQKQTGKNVQDHLKIAMYPTGSLFSWVPISEIYRDDIFQII